MNPLEREILERLLRGVHPVLAVLRSQLETAAVVSREFTGTGFMTDLSVPAHLPRVSTTDRLVIGDVGADVSGLPLGAGFLLFVREGALDALEGYSYDSEWTQDARLLRSFFVHPDPTGKTGLVETAERDLAWALPDAV